MDVNKMLEELRQERDQIDRAIYTLEQLARGQVRRRGRPPAWMSRIEGEEPVKRRGRPPGRKSKKQEGPTKTAAVA